MKKSVCLFLILALLLTGCAWAAGKNSEVTFYYRVSDESEDALFSPDGIMAPDKRHLHREQLSLSDLMELYFKGPVGDDLISPFPDDLHLIKAETTLSSVLLTVSDCFADLSSIELRIAAGCIARTLWEYNNAYSTVSIRAQSKQLAGQERLVIHPKDLVLEDHSIGQASTAAALFFADTENRFLLQEDYTFSVTDPSQLPELVLNALIQGPERNTLRAPLPKGTTLLGVSVADGLCEVDLSEEFLKNRPANAFAERMAIFSIVNSLCALDGIERVRLMSKGNPIGSYGSFNLSEPLSAQTDLVGPVDLGAGETYAGIFLCVGDKLMEFPMRMPKSGSEPAEAVLKLLAEYAPQNGFSSPIAGARINDVLTQGSSVLVEFSADFLEGRDLQEKSRMLNCVANSLRTLDGVSEVRITADGTELDPRNPPS